MNIGDLSPLLLKHIYFVLAPEVFITSDPSMMGKFDHIPELTGASVFQAWKTQIVLALGREGVYNHVSDGMDPTDFAELASHLPTPSFPQQSCNLCLKNDLPQPIMLGSCYIPISIT